MTTTRPLQHTPTPAADHATFTSGKVPEASASLLLALPDSLAAWNSGYLRLVIAGVRSEEVSRKIGLHLGRFQQYFLDSCGHVHLSRCLRRDVVAWREELVAAELERRLGHRSQHYIQRYTNPPEAVAAGYIEQF